MGAGRHGGFSQPSLLSHLCPEDAFGEPTNGALCAPCGTCSTTTLLVVTLVSVALVRGTGGNGEMGQGPGCRVVGCSPEPVLTLFSGLGWKFLLLSSADLCSTCGGSWGSSNLFPGSVSLKEPCLSCCIGLGPSRVPSLPKDKGLENSGLP